MYCKVSIEEVLQKDPFIPMVNRSIEDLLDVDKILDDFVIHGVFAKLGRRVATKDELSTHLPVIDLLVSKEIKHGVVYIQVIIIVLSEA